MRKLLLLLPFLLLYATHSPAQTCNGASPTWTAATANTADVQACFNKTLHCGDVINIPAGSVSWTTGASLTSPPTGCAANQGVTIQGATVCTAGCLPGSGGTALAFTDNTNLTMASTNAFIALGPCSNTSFCRLTGITLTTTAPRSGLNGEIIVHGTFGQVSFRLDHIHEISSANQATGIFADDGYGLIDHYLDDDTGSIGGNGVIVGGDFPSHGYADWNANTTFGTNQFIIVEDSRFNWTHPSGDGTYGGFYGANIVIRHSYLNQISGMGGHGTDSGGFRSTLLAEVYNNTIFCGLSGTVMNTRGGTVLFHDNVVNNGLATCGGIDLQYFRFPPYVGPEMGFWGGAGAGLNWVPLTTVPSGNSNMMTLNAPDWTANHAYMALSAIDPILNNVGTQNYQTLSNCTSGAVEPNPWLQLTNGTIGTTSDGTCNWVNVGGFSAGIVTTNGWCAANPDTMAASNAVCNALSPGDTATRFFDSNGGVYPFRDQPGLIHNQVAYGNFSWNNSGTGLRNPLMGTDSNTASIIQSGRDYCNLTSPGGYTPYTYPDPLTGGSPPPVPIPSWTPTSFNFGNITVNGTGQAQFTLSNSGPASPVLNVSITVSGAGFTHVNGGTCDSISTLGGGNSCTTIVQFNPTAVQSYSGTILENDVANNVSASATVTGSGSFPAIATFIPSPVAFGNQTQNTTSPAITVNLSNTGGAPLTLNTPWYSAITGTNAADFAVVAPTAPTWSLVQHVNATAVNTNSSGGITTVTPTLGSNITATDSLVMLITFKNYKTGTTLTQPNVDAVTGDSDTWVHCPSSIFQAVSVPGIPTWQVNDCYYVSSATGGSATATCSVTTQATAGQYTAIDCELVEFSPNAGVTVVDSGNSGTAVCNTCVDSVLALTGTKDAVFSWITTGGTFSSVNSPYTVLDSDTNTAAAFSYYLNNLAPAVTYNITGGAATNLTVKSAAGNYASAATAVTITNSIAAGELAVITCGHGSGIVATATITDSAGTNTWTQTSSGYSNPGSLRNSGMWYSLLTAPITNVTCTWGNPTISGLVRAVVFDISGSTRVQDSSVNSSSNNGINQTVFTSGALTTTNANDILVYGVSANSGPLTAGIGYTIPSGGSAGAPNQGISAAMSYAVVSTTQSGTTTTMTDTGTPGWTTVFAGFEANELPNAQFSKLAFTTTVLANPCSSGQTLQVGQSCNFQLTFKPTTGGAESATFNISANVTGTVNLTGTGVGTTQASVPVFNPLGGTYTSTQTPTITSSTSGATICGAYGSQIPTASVAGTCDTPLGEFSLTNGGTVSITATKTVNAIATKAGFINSGMATASYVIQAQQNTALQPISSLPAGKWIGQQVVTVSSGTSGSTIIYTLNNTVPTDNGSCTATGSSSSVSSGSTVSINTSEILQMYACASGFLNSPVATYNYQLYAGVPVFSPGSTVLGLQSPVIQVTLMNQTASKMCYTTDLSIPVGSGGTCTNGTLITSGSAQTVTLSSTVTSVTIFAVSTDVNLQSSNVTGATYTLSPGISWIGLLL